MKKRLYILAAGAGSRMESITQGIPKPYWEIPEKDTTILDTVIEKHRVDWYRRIILNEAHQEFFPRLRTREGTGLKYVCIPNTIHCEVSGSTGPAISLNLAMQRDSCPMDDEEIHVVDGDCFLTKYTPFDLDPYLGAVYTKRARAYMPFMHSVENHTGTWRISKTTHPNEGDLYSIGYYVFKSRRVFEEALSLIELGQTEITIGDVLNTMGNILIRVSTAKFVDLGSPAGYKSYIESLNR